MFSCVLTVILLVNGASASCKWNVCFLKVGRQFLTFGPSPSLFVIRGQRAVRRRISVLRKEESAVLRHARRKPDGKG